MRITDFSISRWRYLQEQWKLCAVQALVLGLLDEMVIRAAKNAAVEHDNVNEMLTRTCQVRVVVFNLNSLSYQKSLRDFRFKKADVGRIIEMHELGGFTSRNEYPCHPLTGTCLFLQQVSTTVRWVDIQKKLACKAQKCLGCFGN